MQRVQTLTLTQIPGVAAKAPALGFELSTSMLSFAPPMRATAQNN
jgi:hypothetical protein